jgi:putative NADH-flavin reductase
MSDTKTFVVFGASGNTGRYFTSLALSEGHRVKVLARNPAKITPSHPELEVQQGAVTDIAAWEHLLVEADYVVCMLGDAALQKKQKVNTAFIRELVPAMRRHGVTRLLYQAGGLSRLPGKRLSPVLWLIRNTIARGFDGQHRDNEAVMEYLAENADDLEWMVHRAAINLRALHEACCSDRVEPSASPASRTAPTTTTAPSWMRQPCIRAT